MAKLYVSEFQDLAEAGSGSRVQIGKAYGRDQVPITISGTSAQSAAFGGSTYFVRVHADVICSIRFGSDPTATANDARLAANSTEYFGVRPGDKIAVISNT